MGDELNVLVVMSDQHCPKVLGSAGNAVVRTPNLDALAGAGSRFDAAYCPSPICVPSRAAFATGRWVHEIGYWDNAMGYDGRVEGWGHVLQRAGRRVESIGKLHYRRAEDPTGFDRQTLPMHLKDGIGQVWGSVRDPLPRRRHAEMMVSRAGAGDSAYTRYDAAVTDAACRWLGDSAGSQAWVLYVGLVAPHFPYVAPQRFYDLYDPDAMPPATMRPDGDRPRHPWVEAYASILPGLDDANTDEERRRCTAAYYGLVSYLDDNVGRILDSLHRSGQADRTVVLYTTDHGDLVGSRGLWGKSLLYTESAGIPLMVSGPDVPAGRVCRTPVNLVDLYPTILHGAAVPAPADDRPGHSLLDLAGGPDDSGRVTLSEYHAMGATSAAFLLRKGDHVLHHYVGFAPELFDVAADPDQTRDLAADPAHADVLADLDRRLHALVDPDAVDRRAKADQAALVERFGGPEKAAAIGTAAETPAPATDGPTGPAGPGRDGQRPAR